MPRESRYPLIVFDWDGTLFDSASGIVECIQQAARELGLDVPDRERASHVIGLGLHDSLRHAMPDLPESGYMAFAEAYRRNFVEREPRMGLFDGVPELLVELEAAGYRLAVATGKTRRGLDRAFQFTGLGPHFAASRCADETASKPSPLMLHELMRELSMEPAQVLMIGDTSHDVGMARNAGVDAVAVTYGAHPAESLQALEPRACVDTVGELREWLRNHA